MTLGDVTFKEKLACVERELKMRARAYPRWVASDPPKLSQAQADEEMRRMRAVRDTLVRAEALERVVHKLAVRLKLPPHEYHQMIEAAQDEISMDLAGNAQAQEDKGRRRGNR